MLAVLALRLCVLVYLNAVLIAPVVVTSKSCNFGFIDNAVVDTHEVEFRKIQREW